MMDGNHDFQHDAERYESQTPTMRVAVSCLGGQRVWSGKVTGLFGAVNRDFTIESQGMLKGAALDFTETLRFDDGEAQKRAWKLIEAPDGLTVEGDNVAPLKPGRLIGDGFEISYRIKFGSMWFDYRDVFRPRPDGAVSNCGYVKLLGVTVMKVRAQSDPIIQIECVEDAKRTGLFSTCSSRP